jgi:hypothetical protein
MTRVERVLLILKTARIKWDRDFLIVRECPGTWLSGEPKYCKNNAMKSECIKCWNEEEGEYK